MLYLVFGLYMMLIMAFILEEEPFGGLSILIGFLNAISFPINLLVANLQDIRDRGDDEEGGDDWEPKPPPDNLPRLKDFYPGGNDETD